MGFVPHAGNGKSHYITGKLSHIPKEMRVTIAVNEAFTCTSAIEKLRRLPNDVVGCAVYFNFTILPPVVSIQTQLFLSGSLHFCRFMIIRRLHIERRQTATFISCKILDGSFLTC